MIPESILRSVSKPGRYTGGEYGQIVKDREKVRRITELYRNITQNGIQI